MAPTISAQIINFVSDGNLVDFYVFMTVVAVKFHNAVYPDCAVFYILVYDLFNFTVSSSDISVHW
jgi:hypothetical protein